MKILTVVGARPQFIKAAPVSKALRRAGHLEFLVHTGQHYDHGMSQVFFDELQLPSPDLNLAVGSGTHGWQTGQMLIQVESAILAQQPDCVLVYGDTNSTLAGALAAVKLRKCLAHVEAGLRSFNRDMPEEHNRVLTDHCADMLFCPTQTAVHHLAHEGITRGVRWVGDTMVDALVQFSDLASQRSRILQELELTAKGYLLATVHRPYNTDVFKNLSSILSALMALDELVVFPIHPRTRQKIREMGLEKLITSAQNLRLIDPVGYLDMLILEQHACTILTDSGGIQKEAYVFAVPCITLRSETEWVETLETGWNRLSGTDRDCIIKSVSSFEQPAAHPCLFGDGHAAERIVSALEHHIACA
jgi:UDP-N-acetylglucosamine 2-epimerase